MAGREQAQQTSEKKHGSNPGTFSPDDDEAQDADITSADEINSGGSQRQAQGSAGEQSAAEEDVGEDVGEDEDLDEDSIDDEDEEDDEDDTPIGVDDGDDDIVRS